MLRFIKNKLGFIPCGSWKSMDREYYWGIRSDGVFLDCVNRSNLERAK